MSKYLKWSGIAVAVPVLLTIILCFLFYFPPFQRWAVKQVTAYASEEMGMQITVGHVGLKFPFDLALENVKVLQPNDSLPNVTDTVADIGRIIADIQLLPLLDKQVMVDELTFKLMKVNTADFIPAARIKGNIGHLSVRAHGIDWGKELANIDDAVLKDAALTVALSDTVPPDTTPSKNFWKVNLSRLRVHHTDFTLHMPRQIMSVNTYLGNTTAENVYLDLHKGLYAIRHIDWRDGRLNYDRHGQPKAEGLDYGHLALSQLTVRADSFYYCDSKLDVKIRETAFKEKSGLTVDGMSGGFAMDSTRLALSDMKLHTQAGTALALDYHMDMNAFDDSIPGKFSVETKGQIGKQDLITFAGGSLPRKMVRHWPNKPLVVVGGVRGNLQKAHLDHVVLTLPGAFKVKADGFVENLTNTQRLRANVDISAKSRDLGFAAAMLDKELAGTVRIPNNIGFDGRVKVDGHQYESTFTTTQGGGVLQGNVSLNADRMAYQAKLTAKSLPVRNFLPHMQLHPFTGTINAQGEGTDIFSPATKMVAKTKIKSFRYGKYRLDDIDADATIRNGRVITKVNSRNPLIKGDFVVDALIRGKGLHATVFGDFDRLDLYTLGLTEEPLAASACAHLDIVSDLKQRHQVRGSLSDITLHHQTKVYRPENVNLDILTSCDTTHAIVDCGDFQLNMDASGGYERLYRSGLRFAEELQSQLKNKYIDQERLRAHLPAARIFLISGKDNVVCRFLNYYGYGVDNLFMDMTSSPITGLNGQVQIDSLVVDSFQIDTVRFKFKSDESKMTYAAQFQNGKANPNYVFNAFLDGSVNEKGTYAKARVYDKNDSLGIRLAVQGTMEQNGINLRLFGEKPILGYKEFSVNDSNFIFLGDDRRIRADVRLLAADKTGLEIYSNDDNAEALQDITVSTHHLNIGKVLAMIPYTPDMEGVMNGDFHLILTPSELSVSSTVNVDNMIYEGTSMGDVGTEFTYMPRPDGGHYVDGILTHDGHEVGTLTGTYQSHGQGVLDATMDFDRLPIALGNGFIPDKIIGFKGYADGSLRIRGSVSSPDVNGEVFLDSTYLFSEPYGVEVRFANDPVAIKNSRLLFENFEVFAHNDRPLNIQGYFDFAHTDSMNLNVRMRAENYLLVDAEENSRSDAFGQAYVNFYGTIRGLLDNLKVRGRLDILGSTNLNYNLKDSPLSTDNQLEGLVEFVNFEDTATQVVSRPPLQGLDVDLNIHIDDGAHVNCFLNADHSNYLDLVGGGDMRLRYNIIDELRLTGRYTIGDGEMKYSLPIIPLKTFTIQDGSYLEFRGDPMNPRLNVTATEEIKTSITGESGDNRIVKFTSGVVVTKSLQDMGLEFIIDAPEDLNIHNQLQVMSKEQRGKIAVTMLTTGMYLADGNTKGFTMNSALSAFLNSQINQLSSKALRTLDVSFGVDNAINSSGEFHTDYSFKFAKRFWNNRLRIVIGGKLSSGVNMENQNQTFFDNVTFEYRLSPTSNQYLNLFYERDDYDWLEGNVSKYGGGFIWKRKLRHFKDIFRFHNDDADMLPIDSLNQDSIRR